MATNSDIRAARAERDQALAELSRERSLVDALFRQLQRLAIVTRSGPAAEEAQIWNELNRLFRERGT